MKELCNAAPAEEALTALDTEEAPGRMSPESPEYRILCLLALGRPEIARKEIENLLATHPQYRSDDLLEPPGTATQYDKIRRRFVPQLIRSEYTAAKAHFDTKEYSEALRRFDRMLWLLEGTHEAPPFNDLRLIALGFRDLTRDFLHRNAKLPVRRIDAAGALPGGNPSGRAPVEPHDTVYDSSAPAVVPPVPLKPILPPASRELATLTPTNGLFEILIDEKGQVESTAVKRSVSPQYDQLVLREARNWRYQPATLNGRAVRFRKVIEIYTAPLNSIRPD